MGPKRLNMLFSFLWVFIRSKALPKPTRPFRNHWKLIQSFESVSELLSAFESVGVLETCFDHIELARNHFERTSNSRDSLASSRIASTKARHLSRPLWASIEIQHKYLESFRSSSEWLEGRFKTHSASKLRWYCFERLWINRLDY